VRKRQTSEGQGALFPVGRAEEVPAMKRPRPDGSAWRMPERQGRTVAEIRLRWTKWLTPAQVARVEAELSRVPAALTKLGFGPVQVERAFVRRRRR